MKITNISSYDLICFYGFDHKNSIVLTYEYAKCIEDLRLFFLYDYAQIVSLFKKFKSFKRKTTICPVKCDRLLGSRFTWKQCCRLCCCSRYIQEQQIKKSSIAVLDFYAVVVT